VTPKWLAIKLTSMKRRQERRRDLQILRDKIAKATDEYEDGDSDVPFRIGDKQNDEVDAFDAEVLRLRNEYLGLGRNKAPALEESRKGNQ
jgi:hypothetical protein